MSNKSQQSLLSVPAKLTREEMSALGVLHSWRFCCALLFDLIVLVGAIELSESFFFSPIVYALSVVLIGARLHALGVLMHDAVHYRAFRTRKANMLVGELLGWLVLTTAEGYRNNHMAHHRFLNTDHDPDWARKATQRKFRYPKSRFGVIVALLYQVCGIGIVDLFLHLRKSKEINKISATTRLMRLAFYICVIGLCIYEGVLSKLGLYWLVPIITTFPAFFYVRSVAEHHGNLAYDHTYTSSRTTLACLFERFLFMPHNVGYHLEHHLYPHVPFYRLKTLHGLLMQRRTYAENAHVTRGVCRGLLKEWTGAPQGLNVAEIQRQPEAV